LQIAASAVDSWPEVQFVGAEFEHQDKEALKSRAVAQACENAQKRSKIFEEKLGFKLFRQGFRGGGGFAAAVGDGGKLWRAELCRKGAGESPLRLTSLPSAEAAVAESVSTFGELIYNVEVTIEYQVQRE